MGNKLCCEQEPKKEFDHTITVVHKQDVIRIPELNPVVREHLERQKPFIDQLTTKPSIKEFGLDVYEGKVDERGRPNGFGKMYHKNGSVFVGQFVAGVANGQGHYVKPDGSYYHGRMKNNMANDLNGHYWSPKFEYWGSIVDNQINGIGREVGEQHTFSGNYNKGKKVLGVLTWKQFNQGANQYKYEGGFNNEENFEGSGKLWQKGKGVYTGDFVNGSKHGHGIFDFESGLRYDGEYYHNYKQGNGRIINKNGKVAYQGQFKKGLPHGKGKAPNRQGELQERSWVDGIDKLMIQE